MQDCKSTTIFIIKNLNFIINFKTANSLFIGNYQSVIKIFIYIMIQIFPNFA